MGAVAMEDDGLLLNFSVSETVAPTSASTSKFKGGSWRERLRLQKNAKSRGLGGTNESSLHKPDAAYLRATRGSQWSQQNGADESRFVKRRKQDGEFRPSTNSNPQQTASSEVSALKKTGGREVISSLFTYNPAPKTIEEQTSNNKPLEPTIPSNAPLPDGIDTFTSLGLSTPLAAHLLTKMGLKNPTAIQKATVSQLLTEDCDAFIQSETGSGKTLAYLLPMVQRIMKMTEQAKTEEDPANDGPLNRDSGLFGIVLAPTRELCKQILLVLEKLLGCAHYIVAGIVIGGEKKKSEKARVRKGLNILVATPGRLVDHLENTKSLDVSSVRFLVLDEGDRLMDMGFEEDITKIVRALDGKKRKISRPGLPERRITMLCSATLQKNAQKLGDISLKDAVLIKGQGEETDPAATTANGANEAFLAPAQLKQSYVVAAAKLRLVTLTALLRRTFARKGSVMKAIVFVSCADSVEFHFKTFTRQHKPGGEANTPTSSEKGTENGDEAKAFVIPETLADAASSAPMLSSSSNPLTVFKLHGSLPQATRTAIVKGFATSSQASLLIATDVASRGLDLPNLDLVIEYDPAFSTDEHLHRIGRTARLGRDGRAIIFLLPGKEESYVDILKQSFKQDKASADSLSSVTSQPATDVLRKGFSPATGVVSSSGSKEWESKATDFQLDIERWVLSDPKVKEAARRAFTSHIRAYATHVAAERKFFDIKELHLGHLAKAFGLRDAPGKIHVAGMRSNTTNQPDSKRKDTKNGTSSKTGRSTGSTRSTAATTENPNTIKVNTNKNRTTSTGNQTRDQDEDRQLKRRNPMISADSETARHELKQAKQAKADIDDDIGGGGQHAEDAAQKMRDLVRNRKRMMGAGADEFNIA